MLKLCTRCYVLVLISAAKSKDPAKKTFSFSLFSALLESACHEVRNFKQCLPLSLIEKYLSIYVALPPGLRSLFFPIVLQILSVYLARGHSRFKARVLSPEITDELLEYASTSIDCYKLSLLSLKAFEFSTNSYLKLFQNYIPLWLKKTHEKDKQDKFEKYHLDLLRFVFHKNNDKSFRTFIEFPIPSSITSFLQDLLKKITSPNFPEHISSAFELLIAVLEFTSQKVKHNVNSKYNMDSHFYQWINFLLPIILNINQQPNRLSETIIPFHATLDALMIAIYGLRKNKEEFVFRTLENVKIAFKNSLFLLGEAPDTVLDMAPHALALILRSVKASKFLLYNSDHNTQVIFQIDEDFFDAHINLFLYLFSADFNTAQGPWVIHHFDACVQILFQIIKILKRVDSFSNWILRLPTTTYEAFFQRLLAACILPIHLSNPSDESSQFIQIRASKENKVPKSSKGFLKQASSLVLSYLLKSSRVVSPLLSCRFLPLLETDCNVARTSSCVNMLSAITRLWTVLSDLPLVRLELRNSYLENLLNLIKGLINNKAFIKTEVTTRFLIRLLKNLAADSTICSFLSCNLIEKCILHLQRQWPKASSDITTHFFLNFIIIFMKEETCQRYLLQYASTMIPCVCEFQSSSINEISLLSVWISHTPHPCILLYHLCFEWLWNQKVNEKDLSKILTKIPADNPWVILFSRIPNYIFLDNLSESEKPLALSMITLCKIPISEFDIWPSKVPLHSIEHEWIEVSSIHHPELKKTMCKHCLSCISPVFKAIFSQGWYESHVSKLPLDVEYIETLEDLCIFQFEDSNLDKWWIKNQFSINEGFERLYYLLLFLHRYLCRPLFLDIFKEFLYLFSYKSGAFYDLHHYFKLRERAYNDKRLFLTHFYQAILDCDFFNFSKQWHIHHPECMERFVHQLSLGYAWFQEHCSHKSSEMVQVITKYILSKVC